MTNQIQCPNCSSYDTRLLVTVSEENPLGEFFRELFKINGPSAYQKNVDRFLKGQIEAVCERCKFQFDVNTPSSKSVSSSAEGKLAELERLRVKGLINENEYKQKREEILKRM
jgi:hypothetical protein